MKVITDKIPTTTGVKNALPKIDFTDTFSTTNHIDSLDIIANKIFGSEPVWITFLFKIRNFVMKLFGFKTEIPTNIDTTFNIGSFVGFFEIYSIQQNEIVLGADDKHLKFRVSIYNSEEENYNIKVTTLVEYLNTFGKIYMTVIKPFHLLVVKAMVKNAFVKL